MITTHLPYVGKGPIVAPQGQPSKARQVFALLRDHPDQGRKPATWNELLADIAHAKCMDMAQRGYTGHVNPDGKGPNYMVRAWGYWLPDWYGQADDANNIESLAYNGDGSVAAAWQGWLASAAHRPHVLGENSFFAEQTQVGIGYYFLAGSAAGHYWCVLTCPPEQGRR